MDIDSCDDLEQLPAEPCEDLLIGLEEKLPSSTLRWKYDVFLSFKGEDTRGNFIGHLYTALADAGYRTFRDDDELERGYYMAYQMERAIRQSKILIVVFSENYAFSQWCLDELVNILLQHKNAEGHMVVPVFYHVDPFNVRNQTGSFAEAFARHEKRFAAEMDRVEGWRSALREAANLFGFLVDDERFSRGVAQILKSIIKDIGRKLNPIVLREEELDDVCLSSSSSMVGNIKCSTLSCKYHVFLSFRGYDTGTNFTDHLYTALVDAGYSTFRDEDHLERGQHIAYQIERAIRQSKISIVVFSKNYASSGFCLEELVNILLQHKNAEGHMVLPVFYHVNPSDVRNQTGSFAKAFAHYSYVAEMDRVEGWRDALSKAADLSGYLVDNEGFSRQEPQVLKSIIKDIGRKLNPTVLRKFRQFSFRSWQKGKELGRGSFGTVYEGYTDNGFFFAVKEISLFDKGSQGQESILQPEQEISLLSQFEHENIVKYLGTDKDEAKLYIFLELVTKGSLLSLYRNYALQDSQASSYTRQILNGLKYLHERNVVHRDIKCANILVHANGSVKLADFGLAKTTNLNDINSCKGTAFWMAPEVVNRKKNGYGLAADIWSLGCTVLEMLTRKIPYFPLEQMQALFRIGNGKPPPVPDSLSREARHFINICLQVNPDNRPTAAQLLEHSFVMRSLHDNSSPASAHYFAAQHRSGSTFMI